MARSQATVTTDHDEIRRWAENRGATPACVRGTGGDGDTGMLRLDFPGYSGADSLEHITWDEWFQKFDERGLALLHQDTTARGEKSNFNKIIARETAEHRADGDRKYSRRHPERGRSASARRSSGGTSSGRTGTRTPKRRSARRAAASSRTTKARTTAKRRSGASDGRTSKKKAATKSARTRQRTTASATRRTSRSSEPRAARTSKKTSGRRTSGSRSSRGRIGGGARPLVDHGEIRRWAEERNAAPACVRGTGGKRRDVGMIRLDFPGFSGARSLEHIDWDEWFKAFDDSNLALLVQDTTARGQKSNFNKLVGRETAMARQRGVSGASRRHPERASTSTGSKTRGRESNKSTAKSTRGSSRAKRTESVRGRTESRRRAA